MSRRLATIVLCVLSAMLLQSCITSNLTKYCSFSASPSLRKADSKSLGVVLGWPGVARIEAPYVMLYSPSMEHQEVAIRVNLVAAAIPWPSALNETRCRDLDWRTYRVEIDPEQWQEFWNRPGFISIEARLGYMDPSAKPGRSLMSLRSFAMAWIETTTGESIMSCGCYHT